MAGSLLGSAARAPTIRAMAARLDSSARSDESAGGSSRAARFAPWLGLAPWLGIALVLACLTALRWRLLGVPLERDEGEYAYAGQLLLAGHAPFDGAYNMKLPGIYAVYAAVMALCGETDVGIHLGLLVASLLSTVLVFRLGQRLFDAASGLAAAALFALLALSSRVQGMFANSEHFVLPFALGGCLVLLRAFEAGEGARLRAPRARAARLFLGGCLLGAAFLVKQHALFFVVLGAVLVAVRARSSGANRRGAPAALVLYAAGALLPYAVTLLICLGAGTFERFWMWTFTFARDYVGLTSWEQGARNLGTNGGALARSAWGVSALALAGLAALFLGPGPAHRRRLAAGFAAASAAAICPGLYFRPHYFVLLLPAAALLAALGAALLARALPARVAALRPAAALVLVLAALGEVALKQRAFLLTYTPEQISRALYGPSPFPEARVIGRWIQEHTPPEARIAALCSEPQLYFYARRRASTGFLYLYALMERGELARRMQRDLMAEFEAAPPEILITAASRDSWADYPGTWRDLRQTHAEFFAWYEQTLARYEPVGVADVPARGPTVYRFGDELRGYAPRSPFALFVHRRR